MAISLAASLGASAAALRPLHPHLRRRSAPPRQPIRLSVTASAQAQPDVAPKWGTSQKKSTYQTATDLNNGGLAAEMLFCLNACRSMTVRGSLVRMASSSLTRVAKAAPPRRPIRPSVIASAQAQPDVAPKVVDRFSAFDRVSVLAEALPYLQRFRGKTIVVKYGGAAMKDESLKARVVSDLVLLSCVGINPVLVHGGGPEINIWLNKLGIEAQFKNGLRVTDAATMDVVEMVLGGRVNKSLVSLIQQAGGAAVGLCGKDSDIIRARQMVEKDIGFVGEVTSVNPSLLQTLVADGYIPVVATVASDGNGQGLNVNADTAAGEIAASLRAEKLILMTDVPGVMRDKDDVSTKFASLSIRECKELEDEGIIAGGMIPKGVGATHIIDGRAPHSLLLELTTTDGVGTMINGSSTWRRAPSTLVVVVLVSLAVMCMAVGWSSTRELAALRQTVSLRQVASSAPTANCVAPGGWRTSNKYARVVADRSLPERQLRKGIVSDGGDTSRSRRFLAKLLRGEAVTVVAIGGSITCESYVIEQCGACHAVLLGHNFAKESVKERFGQALQLTSCSKLTPPMQVTLCVVARSSRCRPGHCRVVQGLQHGTMRPVNDGRGKADEIRQAHERLLRKLLVYPNRPAVIELLYYRRPNNFTNELSPYRHHGDDEMGVLAEYYHLPLLSCPVPNPHPEHKWEAWTNGQDHPNDVGHGCVCKWHNVEHVSTRFTYLADMVSTFLTQIMDDLDRHPLEAADDEAAAAELVPPMYQICFPHFQGNYPAKSNACLMGSQFKPLAVTTEGFAWIDEGTADKPKQGWVATTPGSVLEFDVVTDVVPGSGSASVAAAIVYLSSYEHMGQAQVSCVEGSTRQSKTLNGHMTGLGTQQSIMLVELSLAARCRLRVMVLPDTSSGEHKAKITGIIFSETSGWLIRDDVEVQPFRMYES
ncbi:Acetylglutamate kinase [Chlorella vulgaris]